MTEQTIRSMAKELAGIFYEDDRSPGFRRAFPTLRHYMRGQWVQANGDIVIKEPGWTHHIELARKLLTKMLQDPRVHEHTKDRIYNALLDEHSRRTKSSKVIQRQDRPN